MKNEGARLHVKLVGLLAKLELDPKADPAVLAAARDALAAYEALAKRLKDQS